jgi:hypothetical protein
LHLAQSMQSLGKKFCGVDSFIVQSSTKFGWQCAMSNPPLCRVQASALLDAEQIHPSPVPDLFFVFHFCRKSNEPLPAKLQLQTRTIKYTNPYNMMKFPVDSSSLSCIRLGACCCPPEEGLSRSRSALSSCGEAGITTKAEMPHPELPTRGINQHQHHRQERLLA